MKNNTPHEFYEQVSFVDYLQLLMNQGKVLKYTAIPQNMWTRSIQQKVKAKREGVRPGFPDLVVVTKDKVLFIEMKRVKGGVVRPEQKEWLKILEDKKTVSVVCRGADEAIEFMKGQI